MLSSSSSASSLVMALLVSRAAVIAPWPPSQHSPYASQCSQVKLLPKSDELRNPRHAL